MVIGGLDLDFSFSSTKDLCTYIWELISNQLGANKQLLHEVRIHETLESDENVFMYNGRMNK